MLLFVGGCQDIRQINFNPPEYSLYLEGHVILSFSIGKYQQCEERCLLESDCVSVNIGPLVNNKVVCELSNSDHMQHPEDLKPRLGWTYRGTEVRIANEKIMTVDDNDDVMMTTSQR